MHNTDPIEINKFSALAASWWDPQGQCKPLHELNPLRLQFITTRCKLAAKSVLDVGCGGGILSESLAKQGAQVTGIDMSLEVLTVARMHAQHEQLSIQYRQSTVEDFAALHPHSFDVITCMELLEHVPDPVSVIQACAKLLKPDGQLFFSTINRNVKAYTYAVLGAEYLLKMLPLGTHDYQKFIKPSELAAWLRANDLTLQALQGIQYHILSKRYSLSTDVSVNYLAHCQASHND